MADARFEVFQGRLDLVLQKKLEAVRRFNGYGIARPMGHASERAGNAPGSNSTKFPMPGIARTDQVGMGTSETNCRAQFYSLSHVGSKRTQD